MYQVPWIIVFAVTCVVHAQTVAECDPAVKAIPARLLHQAGLLNTNMMCTPTTPQSDCTDDTLPVAIVNSTFAMSGAVKLPSSETGTLLTLSHVSVAGHKVWLGRSYGGHIWEAVAGTPEHLKFSCCAEAYCTLTLINETNGLANVYHLEQYHSTSRPDSSLHQFLIQSTFGPTRSSLEELREMMNDTISDQYETVTAAITGWVRAQMASPPTLHRAYYRERSSPRVQVGETVINGVSIAPCDVGSRWNRFTFTVHDQYEVVIVEDIGGGSYSMAVGGVTRTEVDSTYHTFLVPGSYVICDVKEKVGYGLWLDHFNNDTCTWSDARPCCSKAREGVGNPPIVLSVVNTTTTHVQELTNVATIESLLDHGYKVEGHAVFGCRQAEGCHYVACGSSLAHSSQCDEEPHFSYDYEHHQVKCCSDHRPQEWVARGPCTSDDMHDLCHVELSTVTPPPLRTLSCGEGPATWSDVDTDNSGNALICSDISNCSVLATNMGAYESCEGYCASQGLVCQRAFEESQGPYGDSCIPDSEMPCSALYSDFSSDVICECAIGSPPEPFVPPDGCPCTCTNSSCVAEWAGVEGWMKRDPCTSDDMHDLCHVELSTPPPLRTLSCGEGPATWSDVGTDNNDNALICSDISTCSVLATNTGAYESCEGYCASQGLVCQRAFEESGDSCVPDSEMPCSALYSDFSSDFICECATGSPPEPFVPPDGCPCTCTNSSCAEEWEDCPIWAKSDGVVVSGVSIWNDGTCNEGGTFEGASSMCAVAGGRLCTRQELEMGCTDGTGCGHDSSLIWTSTPYNESTVASALDDTVVLTSMPVSGACKLKRGQHSNHISYQGRLYRFDPRLALVNNSLEAPADLTGSPGMLEQTCPAVEKTFVNRGSCVKRSSCANRYTSAMLQLDPSTLTEIYAITGKPVYVIRGLRLGDVDANYTLISPDPESTSPCDTDMSRWWKRDDLPCMSETPLEEATRATLVAAIMGSDDENLYLRDVFGLRSTTTDATCNKGDMVIGARITIDGICWEHVHDDHWNVYDFSYWVGAHPGNMAFGYNPISINAETGLTELSFPLSHAMSRWETHSRRFPLLGRYGDVVDFADLPTDVQSMELALHFNATHLSSDQDSTACGSPGEVANVPSRGHLYHMYLTRYDDGKDGLKVDYSKENGKRMVWTMIALKAQDQLRQRVAWALSQLLVVGAPGLGQEKQNELWHTFMDIFVRHAFGNYRDILKEVSYSPVMGDYLTFVNNRALESSGTVPDENYAREIMQLFTIGLYQLNQDGSTRKDADEVPLPTYDNDDITTFARAWTGFIRSPFRGNIEAYTGETSNNYIDPMGLRADYRDVFPKADLYGGYIGDRYPLCSDIPSKYFLRPGAVYRNLGPTPGVADVAEDDISWLQPSVAQSDLYAALCSPFEDGMCEWPAEVVLTTQLACHATECEVDTVHVLKIVGDGNETTFYEYVPPACVDLAFFEDGIFVEPRSGGEICTNPNGQLAGPACCTSSSDTSPTEHCMYWKERVLHATALERCTAAGKELCYDERNDITNDGCSLNEEYTWSTRPCTVQIQIDAFGYVTIIHDPDSRTWRGVSTRDGRGTPFQVAWDEGGFPVTDSDCATGCYSVGDSCLCGVTINTSAVFGVGNTTIPTKWDIEHRLRIGSSPPEAFDDGTYTLCRTADCVAAAPDVQVYTRGVGDGNTGEFDEHTIFRVTSTRTRTTAYYANKESTVVVGAHPPLIKCDSTADIALCGPDLREGPAPELRNLSCTPAEAWTTTKLICSTFSNCAVLTTNMQTHKTCDGYCAGQGLACQRAFEEVSNQCVAKYQIPCNADFGHLTSDAICECAFDAPLEPFLAPTSCPCECTHSCPVPGEATFSFRNAPMFMSMTDTTTRDCERETDAVLDHLFYHNNTAPFLARHLIQRFVTSNPSPRYIHAVAEAFRTGQYGDMPGDHSGRYGDMGATMAAVLLDREARATELLSDPTHGQLREPILKVIHTLRSLKYMGTPEKSEVELDLLIDKIGMQAYDSPSVFNFYRPDFQPHGVIRRAGLTSPEFQLASTPFTLGLLNGLNSLVKYGLTSCYQGLGRSFSRQGSCSGDSNSNKRDAINFRDGFLSFTSSNETDAVGVVDELDLLLTGGRLNPQNKQIIAGVYANEMANGLGLPRALHLAEFLTLASAEFHTTNINQQLSTEREPGLNVSSQGRPYKAVVVLFMVGGLDSWSMLVPHSNCASAGVDLYEEYRSVRTNVALAKDDLLPIDVTGSASQQPCETLGVHPSLSSVKQMYDAGDASFIANAGTLVEPLTKEEYLSKTKRVPTSLFAHNIQRSTTQNVHAGHPVGIKPKGVLGRLVEALSSQPSPYKTGAYSFAGIVDALEGDNFPAIVSSTGVQRFEDHAEFEHSLTAMTQYQSGSIYADTFNELLRQSLVESEYLGSILEEPDVMPETSFPLPGHSADECSRICPQFEQVAKMIKARNYLGNERDVFYVDIGGFDTHSDLGERVTDRLKQIDLALASFEAEMRLQGLWDSVVVVTASDFGRTLVSNGLGTDHAWSGNYFLAGGALAGGRVLGQYIGSFNQTSIHNVRSGGRLVPTTSWEAVWHGVALWLGVNPTKMGEVLPNLPNFPQADMFTLEQMFDV